MIGIRTAAGVSCAQEISRPSATVSHLGHSLVLQ